MQTSDIPGLIAIPFANTGSRNVIPTTSQIGITAGAASWPDGFPPLTRTALISGGIAPDGNDVQGVLFYLSNFLRWLSAGGPVHFDATWAATNNGYPAGCVLAQAGRPGAYWISTIDNNSNNPDAGTLTGWLSTVSVQMQNAVYAANGSFSWVCPAGVTRLRVRAWGAGGGGGGSYGSGSAGCGGGGGGYTEGYFGVTPAATYTVVVGAGGAVGGNLPSATPGGLGGASGFGTLCHASGGQGGGAGNNAINVTGSIGGAGSGGSLNISGAPIVAAFPANGVTVGSAGGAAFSSSPNVFAIGAVAINGPSGLLPGSGGSGGILGGTGGVGATGLVLLDY